MEHFINNGDVIEPVLISCDSKAAIAYTKDPKFHVKNKQIDIKFKFVKYTVTVTNKTKK